MFAQYLYREGVRFGPIGQPWLDFVQLTSIEQVWDALSALDGDELSQFIVAEAPSGPEDDEYLWSGAGMVVAGGQHNHYYCEAYKEDRTRFIGTKHGARRSTELAPMAICEVEDVLAHHVIGVEDAREALAAFVERGELSSALAWEQEWG